MGSSEDYKKLGLEENADRETVERKYGAMLRAFKQRTDEHGATDEDMEYYQEITRAYDNIVGTVHDFSDPNPTSPLPFRFRNFFYKLSANLDHFKFFIVAAVILAVMGILIYLQVRDTRKNDIYIKFVGAYYALNVSDVEAEIAEKSDVVNAPTVSFFSVTVNSSINDSETANGSVAFRAQFVAGSIDMIFIDKDNFDVYVSQGVFLRLDDFLEENRGQPGFEDLEFHTYENTGEVQEYSSTQGNVPSGIYGIEFTENGSAYFEDTSLEWLNDSIDGQERSMILCVCRRSGTRDRALEYIKELLAWSVSQAAENR